MRVEMRRNAKSISYELDKPTIVLDAVRDSSKLWLMTETEFAELQAKNPILAKVEFDDVKNLVRKMKGMRWNYGVQTGGSSDFAISGFEPWKVGVRTL